MVVRPIDRHVKKLHKFFIQGGLDFFAIVNTNGTDNASIELTSTAGGVSITGKNSTFTMATAGDIGLTANTASTDNITLTNTQGTGADAINLEASAGGVLVSADGNIASAIKLHATVGGNQTIDVINTAGSGEGAITLTSTAGGVDIDAAAAAWVRMGGVTADPTLSDVLTGVLLLSEDKR